MSDELLSDLLAGFLTPAADALSDATPAKAANSANREHPCGSAGGFAVCEGLRISAKTEQQAAQDPPDSQKFASIRRLQNTVQSEHSCGFSQDSQDSQGSPATTHSQGGAVTTDPDPRVTCTTCRHYWRSSRCLNHRQALLTTSAIGPDLAALPQHCSGFAPLARPPPPPAAAHHHQTDHQTDRDRAPTENPQTEPHHPLNHFKDDITVIISDSGGTAYTPCPPGSYLARCVRLIDLGTQTTDYQGEVKTSRKLLLSWEILDSETRRDDGAPFLLSKRFTTSLHEKSALRKDLASWRGRDFTPPELKGFDLATVLGKDAFISVVQATKPDGRTYSNIGALMRPPKGLAGAPAAEPLLHWDMGSPEPDWRAFELLSPKLQQQIEVSPEFGRLRRPTTVVMTAPAAPARPAAATEPPHAFADLADDIDF